MREIVLTDRGPKPIGPYSQAIKVNGLLFVSGQVAIDPKTNEFVGGDIELQTERTLENVKRHRRSGGKQAGPRHQDHGLSEEYERLRRDERDLRTLLFHDSAGAFDRGSRTPA
jgi:hypothetical protein